MLSVQQIQIAALIYSLGISLRARKQHVAHSFVANCDDSVCNTDETAACHSDVSSASDGSQQRLCPASALVNQASGSQKFVWGSFKNIWLKLLLIVSFELNCWKVGRDACSRLPPWIMGWNMAPSALIHLSIHSSRAIFHLKCIQWRTVMNNITGFSKLR